ncbi:hypothetical protein quinque_008077 [Culex quinquefasciatus]
MRGTGGGYLCQNKGTYGWNRRAGPKHDPGRKAAQGARQTGAKYKGGPRGDHPVQNLLQLNCRAMWPSSQLLDALVSDNAFGSPTPSKTNSSPAMIPLLFAISAFKWSRVNARACLPDFNSAFCTSSRYSFNHSFSCLVLLPQLVLQGHDLTTFGV